MIQKVKHKLEYYSITCTMNAIFLIFFVISAIIMLFINPDAVISSMLSGGTKAVELTVKMTVIYAVWLGIAKIMEQTGVNAKISKFLKPVNRLLFGKTSPEAEEFIAMNMSSNMLGMGGIATPMGINAVYELDKHGLDDAICMLLVITSTSIELMPTTVISLRSDYGSVSPASIFLPTLLSTFISTFCGILLVKIFTKRKKEKK